MIDEGRSFRGMTQSKGVKGREEEQEKRLTYRNQEQKERKKEDT
jgi:hypothetical protein